MNQCEAILSTGPNSGTQCTNSTDEAFCGVHKGKYMNLDLMPDVALRNIFDHLDAESLKAMSATSGSLRNRASGPLAVRKKKHDEAMAYLTAHCDTGDLMERIHHLNNYENYDPTGIVIRGNFWKKGTNKITRISSRNSRGTPTINYIWTNINGQHRIGGPASVEIIGNTVRNRWYENGKFIREEEHHAPFPLH